MATTHLPKHRNKLFNVHPNTQKWQQHICQNTEINCSMYTQIHKNGKYIFAKIIRQIRFVPCIREYPYSVNTTSPYNRVVFTVFRLHCLSRASLGVWASCGTVKRTQPSYIGGPDLAFEQFGPSFYDFCLWSLCLNTHLNLCCHPGLDVTHKLHELEDLLAMLYAGTIKHIQHFLCFANNLSGPGIRILAQLPPGLMPRLGFFLSYLLLVRIPVDNGISSSGLQSFAGVAGFICSSRLHMPSWSKAPHWVCASPSFILMEGTPAGYHEICGHTVCRCTWLNKPRNFA